MKISFFWLVIIFFVIVVACKKDNSGGLNIKIKSISSNIVPANGSLQVILDFTDNGGNAIDSIYMKKIRVNQDTLAPDNIKLDTFYLIPPSYPGKTKGQIQLDLDYQGYLIYAISPPQIDSTHFESDSLIIKFAAKDVAGHKSDTASTGLVVIQRTQ
ncbi:MAG: hypothetical protein JST47_13090 [Bacteroidetes bacterium]|nr:hypothetical protein [Bacteroidota bacterium]